MQSPASAIPDVLPIAKQIGVDEDEAESRVIDKGWLQAVNILIQMADIILVRRRNSLSTRLILTKLLSYSPYTNVGYVWSSVDPNSSSTSTLDLSYHDPVCHQKSNQFHCN
jgi:hypothetical protein